MKTKTSAALVLTVLLAACGGGGDSGSDNSSQGTTPAPSGSTPAPTPGPVETPKPAPTPVPVPTPAPAPNVDPPVAQPQPEPEPAEGTYITGKMLQQVLLFANNHDTYLYRNGNTNDAMAFGYQYNYDFKLTVYSGPFSTSYTNPIPNTTLNLGFTFASGNMEFLEDVQIYSSNGTQWKSTPLFSKERFVVDPNKKYVLNRTHHQWNAVDDSGWFLQLQLSSFDPSNTAFRLCYHTRVPMTIRLQCLVFDKLTGEYRTSTIADDSYGLGSVNYVSVP
jgi:hypothetical protein